MDYKQVKRFLALLKAQAEGINGDLSLELPEGFKESFECQKFFRGWINYHVTWDVDEEDVWKVVPRGISLEEEWHKQLKEVVPVITPEGEIVEAKEWEKRLHSTQSRK